MSKLTDLISPPSVNMTEVDRYKLETSFFDMFNALSDVSNESRTSNADFSTLSAQGTTPTTEADGDDFEFIEDWFVVGAADATYSITATDYPENSDVLSNSDYFVAVQVFTYTGSGLYFYQRYMNKVRYYQNRFVTFTIHAQNNELTDIKLRPTIEFNYDGSTDLIEGRPVYLRNGYNDISITLPALPSLAGKTVNPGNYVEFRLEFAELYSGTADIDLYMIKTEFGKVSTPLP